MKEWIKDFFNKDIISIILISLLLGIFLGLFFKTEYSIPIKAFFNDLNPNSGKDSQTLILDNVTKNTPNINQKNIFETPKRKENLIIQIIKNFSKKNKKTEESTINNYVVK